MTTATITAVIIDSREPDWVQKLAFGCPSSVTMLDAGDLLAVTSDGHMICAERKTPDDLLSTLRDERLFPQMLKISEQRHVQLEQGQRPTWWPYLVITGALGCSKAGKVITPERGETGWSYSALMGALTTAQEMGIFIVNCGGDSEYAPSILSIGRRDRADVLPILPARQALALGAKEQFLASLPGIGVEKSIALLQWGGGRLSEVLVGLTDLDIACPVEGIGKITRDRIRDFLGLRGKSKLEFVTNQNGESELVNIFN